MHSYVDVVPLLAERGCRVLVPYLRGYGPTRFLDEIIPRSGQQGALGADVVVLLNALRIRRAVLAATTGVGVAPASSQRCGPSACPVSSR